MKKLHTAFSKIQNTELDQYQSRLIARLFVAFIFLIQIGQRFFFIYQEENLSQETRILYLLTIPLLLCMIVIIVAEHTIYKKLGPRSSKYTKIIDPLLFGFFISEWLIVLYATLADQDYSGPECLKEVSVFEFTAFGWRSLLQDFIVKFWYVKIIAPISAQILVVLLTAIQRPDLSSYILFIGIAQALYIIFIFYFENKINFNLVFTNLQQQKWVKINEFILNNIPENIVILSLEGEVKYTSDNFKRFSRRCNCGSDPRRLFLEIKNLQRGFEADSYNLPLSSLRAKSSMMSAKPSFSEEVNSEMIESLQEAIKDFKSLVISGSIQEKSFLVFNGRLRGETDEKSIEIKISFIHQTSQRYIILILRDTTHRDRLVASESNNRYKDKLLASVSHELRTPLNGNINLVEAALRSKEVPESIKEGLLGPALKSSKFLLHLINDILDRSQIQAQKLRLVFRSENLKQTLLSNLQLLDLQAKNKGLKLDVKFDPRLTLRFCTDHNRLGQIVLNLVNNSIKFTQRGFVRVKASLTEKPSLVKITIEDSGIGIKKEDIEKLFGRYTHIDFQNRNMINPTGVGLGLSISYNLAQLLGPQGNSGITVESIPGKGSIFSFIIENKESIIDNQIDASDDNEQTSNYDASSVPEELEIEETLEINKFTPLSMKLATRPSKQSITSKIIDSNKTMCSGENLCACPRILVVDDDLFNILAFEAILKSLKIKFECANSGKIAIDKLIDSQKNPCIKGCKRYNLVFMDQEMPEMSGRETVEKIKNLQKEKVLPAIKIIGCTAHNDNEEIKKFVESGINECIQKPISKETIGHILKKYTL